MTYLSRIWLNPWRKKTRQFFRDPQMLHAAVLAGIPSQPVKERILWRLDNDPRRVLAEAPPENRVDADGDPYRIALYVLSKTSPSWDHIVEQAGWPSSLSHDAQPIVRSYQPLLDRLSEGDRFAFRLTANPTMSRRTERDAGSKQATRGARVGHVTVHQQLDWLTSRSPRLGFTIPGSSAALPGVDEVLDVRIVNRDVRRFSKGKGGQNRVTIATATFEGSLIVDDPTRLGEALVEGIGPAKAYGCGLLTLAAL